MRKFYFSAFAAVIALAGCTKEQNPAEVSASNIVFTASMEDTKGELTNKTFTWAEGDEICVSDGTTKAIFVATKVSVDNVATFVAKEGEPQLEAEAQYEAWYPASIANGSLANRQVLYTVGETSKNETEGAYRDNPMHAVADGYSLGFKNLCGMIHFTLNGPSAPRIAINDVRIDADQALSGAYTVAGDGSAVVSAESGYVSCHAQNAKFIDAVHNFYVALPAGTYTNVKITLRNNSNEIAEVITIGKDKSLVIDRNKMYSMTITSDGYTNLSAVENANCYIPINNTLYYKFKPLKGNSNISVGEVASAKVIWEASSSTTAPAAGKIVKDVKFQDGYVRFQRGGNQGNAIIAACDAAGTILWSWHIWAVNALPEDQIYPSGDVVMDRNIGTFANTYATNASNISNSINAAGLFYQWGRKDPFTGRGGNNNTLAAQTGTAKEIVQEIVSVEKATQNPHVFYVADKQVWCQEAEATWDGANKTLQDPCPAGYRVWNDNVWGGSAPDVSKFQGIAMQIKADATQACMGYTYELGDGAKAFYATTGQLNSKDGTFGSALTTYRTWSRNLDANNKCVFYDISANTTVGSIKVVRTSSVVKSSSYGMSVRCERIK